MEAVMRNVISTINRHEYILEHGDVDVISIIEKGKKWPGEKVYANKYVYYLKSIYGNIISQWGDVDEQYVSAGNINEKCPAKMKEREKWRRKKYRNRQ